MNKPIDAIANAIYRFFNPISRFEEKLLRCQAYQPKAVAEWERGTGLGPATVRKILERLEIIDQHRIRNLIKATVASRPDLFTEPCCYVTSFGSPGKSGELIFYEFRHSVDVPNVLEERWRIPELPERSRIVFVDDLIGTGNQSLEYIQTRLSAVLSPSHKPCLFSLCATRSGIEAVRKYSTFDVICSLELDDAKYNFYAEDNPVFSAQEKMWMRDLNERLGQNLFVMGLLLSFYYSAPDNAMPFLWKTKFASDADNKGRVPWVPLFPRSRK